MKREFVGPNRQRGSVSCSANAAFATAGETYTITIGVSGDFLSAGYASGFGSSSPSSPTVKGNTLNTVIGHLSAPDFRVQIAGSFLAQTFFTRIDGFDGAGSPFGYATASASTFISNSTAATWIWNGTADWQFTDSGENHDVTFT